MLKVVLGLFGVLVVGVVVWFFIVQPSLQKKQEVVVQPGKDIAASRATGGNTAAPGQAPPQQEQAPPPAQVPQGIGANPDAYYEPGEIIVTNPPKNFDAAASVLGFTVVSSETLPALGIRVVRLRVPAGTSVPRARRLLAAQFPSASVDANHHYEAQQGLKTSPRTAIGWGPATPSCGRGIRLGQIDAAVDVNHPALLGQRIQYKSFHRQGNSAGPADHGTAVAGILVGKPSWGGLLPGADLFAVNMFEKRPDGRVVGNALALIKGIDWLAQNKTHVINMSVAGADNKVVRSIITKAMRTGLAIVAAAGNWGVNGKPAYPAAYNEVLAVTAFNSRRMLYSHANRGDYIDFAAPGVQIWTPVPGGGRYQSGTSFAAPFISVLIALHTARGVGGSADELRQRLQKASVDLGIKGKDKEFGFGFVNMQPKCV
ncbi:MAG: S8 family serine peptidase [Rhodospirillales bacterium]